MKSGGGFGTRISIEGGAELERKLQQLDRKVSRKITSTALRAGAKVILGKAKAEAPKRSGLLAKSLKVRAAKRKKGMARFTVQTADGFFRGETFYAAFIEFGHKVGSRKLASRKEVPAQPFLKPAFDRGADEAVDVITGVIRRELFALAK